MGLSLKKTSIRKCHRKVKLIVDEFSGLEICMLYNFNNSFFPLEVIIFEDLYEKLTTYRYFLLCVKDRFDGPSINK